jgi:hypothetical protein
VTWRRALTELSSAKALGGRAGAAAAIGALILWANAAASGGKCFRGGEQLRGFHDDTWVLARELSSRQLGLPTVAWRTAGAVAVRVRLFADGPNLSKRTEASAATAA